MLFCILFWFFCPINNFFVEFNLLLLLVCSDSVLATLMNRLTRHLIFISGGAY